MYKLLIEFCYPFFYVWFRSKMGFWHKIRFTLNRCVWSKRSRTTYHLKVTFTSPFSSAHERELGWGGVGVGVRVGRVISYFSVCFIRPPFLFIFGSYLMFGVPSITKPFFFFLFSHFKAVFFIGHAFYAGDCFKSVAHPCLSDVVHNESWLILKKKSGKNTS